MDSLYKGILKNYSVKLADGIRQKKTNQIQIYKSIFETLEEYKADLRKHLQENIFSAF